MLRNEKWQGEKWIHKVSNFISAANSPSFTKHKQKTFPFISFLVGAAFKDEGDFPAIARVSSNKNQPRLSENCDWNMWTKFVNIFVYCRWCSFQWKPFLGGFSSFFCWCLQPWAILCGSNWIRYLFMKSKDQQSLDWESFMKYWECLEFRHDLFPSSSNLHNFSCFITKPLINILKKLSNRVYLDIITWRNIVGNQASAKTLCKFNLSLVSCFLAIRIENDVKAYADGNKLI